MVDYEPVWFEDKRYSGQRITSETLINAAGRKTESLAGKWNHAPDQYSVFFHAEWWKERLKKLHADDGVHCYDYSYNNWETIDVPGCVNLQKPEYKYYESVMLYTRRFHYKPSRPGERVFIRVGAANYLCAVFVNQTYLGFHSGGSTPFCVEITDLVKQNNRIILAVDCGRRQHWVPTHITDWFNYGGLHRGVELIRVPPVFIKDAFVRLAPGSDYKTIAADVSLDGGAGKLVRLRIDELKINVTETADEKGVARFKINVAPTLWSPENPKRYAIRIETDDDAFEEVIGFRDIRVEGTEILLNGKPVWLKGVCQHEDDPVKGRTLSEDDIRANLKIIKELNGNFIRLAHYPHNELTARIADEMGIMVWAEIPVYWKIAFDRPDTFIDAENQLKELVLRDRNRASVIIWSVGNENPDSDERLSFMSRLAACARGLDNTRLISAACLTHNGKFVDRLTSHLDVWGFNEYFGWYSPIMEDLRKIESEGLPAKPVIISEMGGGAPAGNHGPADQMWTEEFQERIYQQQVKIISELKSVRGLTPWILYDFRAPFRLNMYQNGYNRKGLLSADRQKRKKAFYVLQAFYKTK